MSHTTKYSDELCKDCQKLGYCRLKAIQAEVDLFRFNQTSSLEFPILSADPEPVPTFREYVKVHRPDLLKVLPAKTDQPVENITAKKPTLGELRAMMKGRRESVASTESVKNTEPSEIVVAPGSSKPGPLTYAAPRLSRGLLHVGRKPARHERKPGQPEKNIYYNLLWT